MTEDSQAASGDEPAPLGDEPPTVVTESFGAPEGSAGADPDLPAPPEPAAVAPPSAEPFAPPPPPMPSDAASGSATQRPEIAVGAAFAGGFALALILKRIAR